MVLQNRFEALSLYREPGPPGSRSAKKKERASQHIRGGSNADEDAASAAAAALSGTAPRPTAQQAALTGAAPPPEPACKLPYRLALAADSLLVALESGSHRQLACFTVDGPEQAADEGFLAFVHQEVWRQLQQQESGQRQSGQQQDLDAGQRVQHDSSSFWDRQVDGGSEDAEVTALLDLMMGRGGGGHGGGEVGTAGTSCGTPVAGVQRALWSEVAAAGAGQQEAEDQQLAAALQATEDEEAAAAGAGAAAAAAGNAQLPAAVLALSDWELAQQWQEEEDAALAAALAAQEEAADGGQAAAARSSSFWSRFQRVAGADACSPTVAALAAEETGLAETAQAAGAADTISSFAGEPFPSLQAAARVAAASVAGGGSGTGSRPRHSMREQLLCQHQAAKQAKMERGSGVRLLNRGSTCSSSSSPGVAGSLLRQRPGGPALPPLQLEEGMRLHEDDLHYQLLLKDDSVTAAARAAADSYADREEALQLAAGAGGGGMDTASAEAMRAMIDATARRVAAAAGGSSSSSRPGSAGGVEAPPSAGPSRPSSAAFASGYGDCDAAGEGAAETAGEAGAAAAAGSPVVEAVDTKSCRRLQEDMKRRGWQLMGCAGGGHIRCERTFPDLPGFKQVYFLCSTPSDVNYLWNCASAVKRFDREVQERRAAAVAAKAAESDLGSCAAAGGGNNSSTAAARRPSSRQRR